MEQYISKAALVAEIENHINRCNIKKQSCPVNTQVEAICDNKIYAYKELLSFIDTLEVKEVDLDKPFEGIKVQTSMESGSLDEVIVTTKYKAQKGE